MKLGAFLGRILRGGRAGEAKTAQSAAPAPAATLPGEADARLREGIARYERSDLDGAARFLAEALDLAHDCAPAHYHLGMIASRAGETEDAVDRFQLAVHFSPSLAGAHRELGCALQRLGDLQRAEEACARACALEPGDALNHFAAAGVSKAAGDLDRARLRYEAALGCRPDFAQALCNLGYVLHQLGRGREALECYDRALAIEPAFVEVIHNRGLVLLDQGDPDRALACFARARALRPSEPAILAAEGHALRDTGRLDEAVRAYDAALAVQPNFTDAVSNRAQTLLALGDLNRGWEEHERRFDAEGGTRRGRPHAHPQWRGEDPAGGTLLVWGEQGIGDEILFASTYEDLIARGARCVLECAPKLVPVLARSFPGAVVVARSDPPHAATREGIHWQCAAGSIARYVRPTLASFPSRPAFLLADEGRVQHWRQRVAALGPGLKAGFAWRSSNLRGQRALSCTRLADWGPLFRVPGVRWVCLQYGECGEELEAARRALGVDLHRFGEVDYFDDLDEVSALMRALDLVISAPTVVSVQAAALGVEVWQTSYGPDWQTHGTQANPWFPSMVRFQRRRHQGWPEVLEAMGRRVDERVSGDASSET